MTNETYALSDLPYDHPALEPYLNARVDRLARVTGSRSR
jgi:hypothetical protein